jgi:hypothetical protein
MKNHHLLLLPVIFLLAGTYGHAQFTVSGEFRPRLEYRDGYTRLRDSSQSPYVDILGRNRILFDFMNEKFTTRFSLQHAFVFGENNFSSDTITRNTVNIFEAWFRYSFTRGFAIKAGRMDLSYDDQRLIGSSNWRQWGATHDLVMLQWEVKKAGYTGDLGFAINNTAPAQAFLSSYTMKNYKYMAYLWQQKKFFDDKLTLSLLAIMDINQRPNLKTPWSKVTGTDTLPVFNTQDSIIGYAIVPIITTGTTIETFPNALYARGTIGGNIWFGHKNLSLFGNGFYQFGSLSDGRKVSSWFYSAIVAYRIVKALKIQVAWEQFSGNNYSDTTDQKQRSTGFCSLWGSSHNFYGYMDMFSAYVPTGNHAGLNDLWVRAVVNFTEKTYLEATYRWFSMGYGYLPAKVIKPGDLPYQEVKKSLGSEIDLMLVYKPWPNVEVNGAYCIFLPTQTMEIYDGLKPGTSKWAQYAYIMVTYKPVFFNSDKH